MRRAVLALAAALVLAGPAAAQEGRYSGASSIAGGTGKCWGNAPADGVVSGGTVTIRYVAYDGTQASVSAQLGKDGTFSASHAIKDGKTIAYAGKVTGRGIVATWKGPDCYGTLDLSR
ncbi:hypothetical protein [Prosthecomicrobium sp. N25]|uniref:hypothetical protein n=1 Tax=Prosthecomicrobium sp. N25 TaxID=3129254 RepID=UPI003077CE9A